MKCIGYLSLVLIYLFINGCGKGTVSVSNENYEARIVIEGLLQPECKVSGIQVTRNFPVGADLNTINLVPDPLKTVVFLTDLQSNNTYSLRFHGSNQYLDSCYYYYHRNDLIIEYGKSYCLEVYTEIDGKDLYARSVTTVPRRGFCIDTISSKELRYYQKDRHGEEVNFEITINRSPGTTFYLFTYLALDASKDSFIYENPFEELRTIMFSFRDPNIEAARLYFVLGTLNNIISNLLISSYS